MSSGMKKSTEKIVFVDILKAIACLCVLIGHVINGMMKDGMDVSEPLRLLNSYVYLFHVPCFFFASGYLYANKRLTGWREYLQFVGKKLITLAVPYFACSIAYILFSSIISSEMHTAYAISAITELWRTPVAQYWYLYALFEMFLLVPVIERILPKVDSRWIFLLFVGSALWIDSSVNSVAYLASYTCFFYLGVCFRRADLLNRHYFVSLNPYGLLVAGLSLSMIVYFFYRLMVAGNVFTSDLTSGLKCITRLLLVVTIVVIAIAVSKMNNKANKLLLWLSQFSLYIYLFHTWFTGSLRILLRKTGIRNDWIQAVCGIAIGLVGSLVAAMAIKRVPLLRIWIEPLQVMKKKEQ